MATQFFTLIKSLKANVTLMSPFHNDFETVMKSTPIYIRFCICIQSRVICHVVRFGLKNQTGDNGI